MTSGSVGTDVALSPSAVVVVAVTVIWDAVVASSKRISAGGLLGCGTASEKTMPEVFWALAGFIANQSKHQRHDKTTYTTRMDFEHSNKALLLLTPNFPALLITEL